MITLKSSSFHQSPRTNNSNSLSSNATSSQETALFNLPTEIRNKIEYYLSPGDIANLAIAERIDLDSWHRVLGNDINEGHMVATMMGGQLPDPKILNCRIPCIPIFSSHKNEPVEYKLPIEIVLNDIGILHNEKSWDDMDLFKLADKLITNGAKVPSVNLAATDLKKIVELPAHEFYLYLRRNPDIISMKDLDGNSLLHLAVTAQPLHVLPNFWIILQEKACDFLLKNQAGDIPLNHAAKHCFEYFIARYNNRLPALLSASLKVGNIKLAELNNNGFNVLHIMSQHNHLRYYDDPRADNPRGLNLKNFYKSFVKILHDAGFNLNSLSREGCTALKYAVDNYNFPMVLSLLHYQAKFASEDEKTATLQKINNYPDKIDPDSNTAQLLNKAATKLEQTSHLDAKLNCLVS